jgi:uncharacterized protein
VGSIASALANHRLIALDTSVWIYHFEGSPVFGPAADDILNAVTRGRVDAIVSELVLLELLVAPLKKKLPDVADEIELTLTHFPHLALVPISRAVLVRAAEIRAKCGMRTPDAIMLATAVERGATLAVTNDAAWRKVDGIDILLLSELES